MYFGSQFNFALQFPSNTPIIGFEVYPVREIKKKGEVIETVRCEPEKAQAFTVMALVPDGKEWIADFKREQCAHEFSKCLQNIYSAGLNSAAQPTPAKRVFQYVEFEMDLIKGDYAQDDTFRYTITPDGDKFLLKIFTTDGDESSVHEYRYGSKESALNDLDTASFCFDIEFIQIV